MGRIGYSVSTVKELRMSEAEQRRFSDLLDEIDRAFLARREVDLWNIKHQLKAELEEVRGNA